jgi:hypothetical protein
MLSKNTGIFCLKVFLLPITQENIPQTMALVFDSLKATQAQYGQSTLRIAAGGTHNLTAAESAVYVDAASTVVLPLIAADTAGKIYSITKNTTFGTVTIEPTAPDVIGSSSASSVSLLEKAEHIRLQAGSASSGKWFVI